MPGDKPWFADEWTEERVERGRRLAASSPDHTGSDLQHFLAQMDASEAVHRAFLAPTSRERLQHRGMAMYLRNIFHELMQHSTSGYYDWRVLGALEQAAVRAGGSGTPACSILGSLAFAAVVITHERDFLSRPAEVQEKLLRAGAVEAFGPDSLAALQELEQYQRTALGLDSPLTSKDLRVLVCLLRSKAATNLLAGGGSTGVNTSLQPPLLEAELDAADRQLEQLLPGDASVLLRRALKLPMTSRQGVQACRDARAAARAEKAHFLAAASALALAFRLFSGACGDWSLAEVQQLLDDSQAVLAFCKPWMIKAGIKAHELQLAAGRQIVSRAEAQHPIKRRLPVAVSAGELDAMLQSLLSAVHEQPECSGCGRRSAHLRKCSRCRVAAYCSRDCQVKHWRQGHKEECARLASSQRGA